MKLYYRHRRLIDWAISLTIGTLVYLSPGEISSRITDPDQGARALLTIASMSATLLGFTLASGSFFVAQMQSKIFEFLKKTDGFLDLIDILHPTLWRLFVLANTAMFAYFLQSAWHIEAAIISFAGCMAILSLISIIWGLTATLKVMAIANQCSS